MTNLSKERKRAEGKSVSAPVKSELSRQLCEICGIEPEIIEDYDSNEYEIYPDFEQAENFVKLLEIVSKKSGVSFCHNGTYFGCSIHYYFKDIFEADKGNIQHNFLNTLLKQDLRNTCKPKLLESIKLAIREAEWAYE